MLQGDPLSPLLFIRFLADLPLIIPKNCGIKKGNINHNILKYADDIALLAQNRTFLKSGMKALRLYFTANDLVLNINKSKIIRFSKKSCHPSKNKFKWNGHPIEVVPRWNYLGITFQSTGIFTKQAITASIKAKNKFAIIFTLLTSKKSTSCRFS